MRSYDNTWDVSGAMCHMGDMLKKCADTHNEYVDIYGYHSTEASFQWYKFHAICDCVRAYKGFDVDWIVFKDDTRKISEISIMYYGGKIGFSWRCSK